MPPAFIQRLKEYQDFLRQGIWSPRHDASWYFHIVRLVLLVIYGFRDNKLFSRAAALSYSSILASAPLLALVVLMAGFALDRVEEAQLIEFVNQMIFLLAPPLIEQTRDMASEVAVNPELMEFLRQLIENAQSGAVGLVGILTLLFISLQLFSAIEGAFNEIWGVARGRAMMEKVVFYWTFISLGSLLLLVFVGIFSARAFVEWMDAWSQFPVLGFFLRQASPYFTFFLLLGFLTVFYRFIPNTRVRLLPAILGAACVVILLSLNNTLSFFYLQRVVATRSLYGSLALVPVLLLALYVFWLILLAGGQITYALQNARHLAGQRIYGPLSPRNRFIVQLSLLFELARRFIKGEGAASISSLKTASRLPDRLVNEAMNGLCKQGWIDRVVRRSGEKETGSQYLMAVSPEKIPVTTLIERFSLHPAYPEQETLQEALDPGVSQWEMLWGEMMYKHYQGATLAEFLENYPAVEDDPTD